MTRIEDLKFLLQKLEIIALRYSAQYEEAKFNVFSILRSDDDEVHLHSAFIAELLNPKGSHGLGGVFLEYLLKELNISFGPSLENREVTVEAEFYSAGFGRIDLLVKIPGHTVIIENKIHGPDQGDNWNDILLSPKGTRLHKTPFTFSISRWMEETRRRRVSVSCRWNRLTASLMGGKYSAGWLSAFAMRRSSRRSGKPSSSMPISSKN